MSFSEKDKGALIEVVNHIHHAYATDEAFKEGDPTSILLPSRLVHLTAEALGQTYDAAVLSRLDKSEMELLLTSLLNSVDLMLVSFRALVKSLPDSLPVQMVERVNQRIEGMEAIKRERQTPSATRELIDSGSKVPAEELDLEDLQQRYEEVAAEDTLTESEAGMLYAEIARLESIVRPRHDEMQQLQLTVTEKAEEFERLASSITEAQEFLSEHDKRGNAQLEQLLDISGNLIDAMEPYRTTCGSRIRDAVEAIAEKVSEGRHLKTELQARINEVSEVVEETTRLSAVLNLYAKANRRVVFSVPTVLQITKEKLRRVEEQLQQVDADLKQALAQHQQARHVAEVARV